MRLPGKGPPPNQKIFEDNSRVCAVGSTTGLRPGQCLAFEPHLPRRAKTCLTTAFRRAASHHHQHYTLLSPAPNPHSRFPCANVRCRLAVRFERASEEGQYQSVACCRYTLQSKSRLFSSRCRFSHRFLTALKNETEKICQIVH
jgi:hypothetical protein